MTRLRSAEDRSALRIAALYVAAGALWITFSDRALGALVSDPARLTELQTLKGWLYVLASGLLMFVLVRSAMVSLSRSRAQLRETEELVRQVADHTSAAIWAYAAGAAEALYLSPSAEAIWGRTLAEMYSEPRFFLDQLHPEDRAEVLAAFEQPGEATVEFRITRGDGEVRWLRSISSPILDENGRVKRVVGITDDVTATKETERARRESEERFHQLAENIPQVFWMTSLDGRELVYVSSAYESVFGRSRDALLQEPGQWLEAVHPEDRARVVAALPKQPEGTYDDEYRIVRPDGIVRWVRSRAFPVRNDRGEAYRVAGTVEDVTDRRYRDEELLLLAAAIAQTGEGVLITDAAGTILYVNPAFEKVTGYTRREAVGQNPRILKSGRYDTEYYRRMWSTLLAGDPVQGRVVNRRKDGSLYTQDSCITPVRSGGGEITHMVAVFRDVTHDLQLEDQLRQAQKMEAIGRLAGGIAHDFNNVLTAIKGHAHFALETVPAADPLRDDIAEIVGAADRAGNLTRQLLAFSRQQVSVPRVLCLREVIRGAERMLGRLIGEDVEIEISLAPDLGRVLADPTHIEQVLVNLAVNGRDAMPGGGRLAIEAENVELGVDFAHRFTDPVLPGRYVRLSVSDTGSGMDAKTLERIFEPFFTTKEQGKGTGLGLSTVYGIVRQAGGYVWVYSEPGQGTTFKVYLPRTEAEPEARVEPITEAEDRTGTGTVLVVEDQESVRSLVRRTLAHAGYRVLEAANGTEALRRFEQEEGAVDLLCTDVVMPQMGGRELAARLRELRPELPVLFMSGYAEHEIAQRGVLEPGTHFLEKPFEPGTLQRRVGEVLGRAVAVD